MLDSLDRIDRLSRRLDRLLAPDQTRPSGSAPWDDLAALGIKVPLVAFVHLVSQQLDEPVWLAPYLDELEHAIGTDKRLCVAAPPQHGKTVCSLHAFLWWDLYYPGKRHVYVTYNQDRTRQVAKDFTRLAEEAGFEPEGTLAEIRLRGGSTVRFTSVLGGLTGYAIDGVCLIDDPIKDHVEARSPAHRRDTHEFWSAVARSRRHPGTSFIEMATRWHTDDLTGHLLTQQRGWSYLNLKAIAEGTTDRDGIVIDDPLHRPAGQSLWPAMKPPEFFTEERSEPYWWAAMYQGEPIPDGAQVFRDVQLCADEDIPRHVGNVAIGVDFGYSNNASSDYSIAVVLANAGEKLFVLEVLKLQVEPRIFRDRCAELAARYPTAQFATYIAPTEQGNVEFMREAGISITSWRASTGKLARAVWIAARWNQGDVMIPASAPWRADFVRELCGFTGDKAQRGHDDQVDSIAAAYECLRTGSVDLAYYNRLQDALPKPIAWD